MLPFRARVDIGPMVMKECSAYPKVPAILEPHDWDTRCGSSYSSAEKQPVYSTAPADEATVSRVFLCDRNT